VPKSFSVAASITAPCGNIFNSLSAFLLTNCCIAVASPFDKLAAGTVSFLTGIPISSAIILGAKSPSFLNF
jgi:cation transporter-like permease